MSRVQEDDYRRRLRNAPRSRAISALEHKFYNLEFIEGNSQSSVERVFGERASWLSRNETGSGKLNRSKSSRGIGTQSEILFQNTRRSRMVLLEAVPPISSHGMPIMAGGGRVSGDNMMMVGDLGENTE